MNKKKRQIIFSALLILTLIAVWWVNICSPLKESLDDLSSDHGLALQKKERLANRIEILSKPEKGLSMSGNELTRFNKLLVKGESIEEINTVTQAMLQKFIESKGIVLNSYKELRPVKWRNYKVGVIQFQMQTTITGLSDLLAYVDSLKRVIRIEKLNVSYNKRKEDPLLVIMQVGTLFVEKK